MATSHFKQILPTLRYVVVQTLEKYDMQPLLRMGRQSTTPLTFTFDRVAEPLRVLLLNLDQSGSMQGSLHHNLSAFERVVRSINEPFDVIVVHGFGSYSIFNVVWTPTAAGKFSKLLGVPRVTSHVQPDPASVLKTALEIVRKSSTYGDTNPTSAAFLDAFAKEVAGLFNDDVDLYVVSTSDGGFNRGADTTGILKSMRSVISVCRPVLAANVLVGSAGSPLALSFFTGEPDRFEALLLFSTDKASDGVLRLRDFDPTSFTVDTIKDRVSYRTVPPVPIWAIYDDSRIAVWCPETDAPPSTLTVRKSEASGGRRFVYKCDLTPAFTDVTLERDGQEVFALVAKSHSDNPYTRETSRAALNALVATLEKLLTTRSAVLAMITASDEEKAAIQDAQVKLDENTAAIQELLASTGLSRREVASRLNTLNLDRHLLKQDIREKRDQAEQRSLERELGFYENHPNHWLVWLSPALDELKSQLSLVQADPGDVMAHLSTRIRTAKSVADGQSRSADRYLDKLLATSRGRRDYLNRKADPRDDLPVENVPASWGAPSCPITGKSILDALGAVPFVADRGDLTSGNLMAGGQAVDRLPVGRGEVLSMDAVKNLMWGDLGQFASPYVTGTGMYNAAIPVLCGQATPRKLRELEASIGWLCTGTSAFGPQMAEAVPGALVMLLGVPTYNGDDSDEVQAILRTVPLVEHFRSYPYAPGTVVLDETAKKAPLPEVWGKSVRDALGKASLQNMGCITSLFARALAGDVGPIPLDQYVREVALDLFTWGCRNIGRSLLAQSTSDGSTGVEGVVALANAIYCNVEYDLPDGYKAAPLEVPKGVNHQSSDFATLHQSPGFMSEDDFQYVLGSAYPHWDEPEGGIYPREFTDAFNLWAQSLPPEILVTVLSDVRGIFSRLDEMLEKLDDDTWDDDTEDDDTEDDGFTVDARTAAVAVAPITSHSFDGHLDLLKPQRVRTAPPRMSSVRARMRRMKKDGKTSWVPPNSYTPVNGSLLTWLEHHTAFQPLRAWLRLEEAGLIGHGSLSTFRQTRTRTSIPSLVPVISRLASKVPGGLDTVLLQYRRALAFVADNAHGYADNQWSESKHARMTWTDLDRILGPRPRGSWPAYRASDSFPFPHGPEWPKLDGRGYLPKTRWVDNAGRTVVDAPALSSAEKELRDDLLCQQVFQKVQAAAVKDPVTFVGGLHRQARAALGDYSWADLSTLPAHDRIRVISEELVPIVAGKVRGNVAEYEKFFDDCAAALYQLCEVGVDTRKFTAVESPDFLAVEASYARQKR